MSEEGMRRIVDLMLEGDENDFQEIKEAILLENDEERIMRTLGDSTYMNYLLKFEEYLDDHDVYLFDGWEDAKMMKPVTIDRFWAEFLVWFGPEADLRGATRLTNDKEAQNSVKVKKLGDKGYILKFRILKRYLDAIEQRSKERAEQLSDEQLEQMA
jgi:hypothetical protein